MFQFPPLTPFAKKLLITLFASYLLVLLIELATGASVVGALALGPNVGLSSIWQVFTYALVYPPSSEAVWHLLLTMIFLWLMLPPLEVRIGARRTFTLALLGTVAAGIAALLALQVLPGGLRVGAQSILLVAIAAQLSALPKNAMVSPFGFGRLQFRPATLLWIFVAFFALLRVSDGDFAQLVGDLAAVGVGLLYMKRLHAPKRTPRPGRRKGGSGRLRVIEGGANGDSDDGPKWLN